MVLPLNSIIVGRIKRKTIKSNHINSFKTHDGQVYSMVFSTARKLKSNYSAKEHNKDVSNLIDEDDKSKEHTDDLWFSLMLNRILFSGIRKSYTGVVQWNRIFIGKECCRNYDEKPLKK